MNDKEFSDLAVRLEKAGAVVEKLPSEIRESAFGLMHDYVVGYSSNPSTPGDRNRGLHGDDSRDVFLSAFDHDKPADNVKLIAADFYRQYGTDPFTAEEVREAADDIGITVPQRVDMTLVQAKSGGKKLFQRAGTGYFKPTVHGEAYLKQTYSVRKGNGRRQRDGS